MYTSTCLRAREFCICCFTHSFIHSSSKAQELTNTSFIVGAVGNQLKTPVRRFTSVTSQTTDTPFTATLTGLRVTR